MKKVFSIILILTFVMLSTFTAFANEGSSDDSSYKDYEKKVEKEMKRLEQKYGGKFTILDNSNSDFSITNIDQLEEVISNISVETIDHLDNISYPTYSINTLNEYNVYSLISSNVSREHVYYTTVAGINLSLGSIYHRIDFYKSSTTGYFTSVINQSVYTTSTGLTYTGFTSSTSIIDSGRTLTGSFSGLANYQGWLGPIPYSYSFDANAYDEFGYTRP